MNRPTFLVMSALTVCQAFAVSNSPAAEPVTFNKHIAPLVFQRCAACHRPGEVAPFALLTYRDVSKRAEQIAAVTEQGIMPPWRAVTGHGEFANGRRLTAEEIALVRSWVASGAVEGDPADLPALPTFATGWQLGEPDLIVTMPQAYHLLADGKDVYRNFVINMDVPDGKFIRAVEYRPSNRRIVHHAGLSTDAARKSRELDGKDGEPGFSQVGISGGLLPGSLGFWVPGKQPQPLPEGISFAWPKGADFILQLHLHPSGKPEVEQSTVGFYFTSERPRRSLHHFIIINGQIDIPPGEQAYRTRATKTLHSDCEVHGIFPHMHLIGKESKVTAVLPDGSRQSLLWIDGWDFNWQHYYEYAHPVALPRGTEIVMENVHDNSADNAANPNQPPRRIVAGEQTTNEMSAVLLITAPKPPSASDKVRQPSPQAGSAPAGDDVAEKSKHALAQFDKNGDNVLSLDEIEAAAGGRHTRAQLEEQLGRFDRNGDKQWDAAELAEAIKTLTNRP